MQLDRLARVIPTGCQGNPKSLPDDVLKVRVGYESAAGGRKAPRQAVWGHTQARGSLGPIAGKDRIVGTENINKIG